MTPSRKLVSAAAYINAHLMCFVSLWERTQWNNNNYDNIKRFMFKLKHVCYSFYSD